MGFNTRELYLILRARDEASRVMRGMGHTMRQLDKDTLAAAHAQMARGTAMATIGTGIATVGAAGIAFYKSAIEAGIKYNQQAALTKTQTDKVKISIEQLKAMSDDVASRIPVPFESLQGALYDIFSSIDVNAKDAHLLLQEFAKSAVAGQTDIQVAGRATIAVLNAFKMPIKDVTRVNDVMFQLVRKGVGTYEEFTKTIGRAIPSTARAGQSFETLAGMLAFLTRNGLSTAMAATSAARAMDAMSNPKTIQHFKDIGIEVKNAKGEFRPMNSIMDELGKKMANMTKPQRAKALHALFLGSGGTIQARRFFDLAITNYAELNQRVKEMHKSGGAMKDAYDVMFSQPLTKMQLFQNNWKVLQHQMGDALLPIVGAIAKAFAGLFMWFNKLSPSTKKWVTIIGAAISVLMVVGGIITAIAGLFLMFAASVTLAGTTMSAVLLPIAAIIAGIIALVVVVVLIVKYHKQIWAFILMVWNAIKNFLISTWNSIVAFIVPWATKIWSVISGAFMAVYNAVSSYLNLVFTIFKAIWSEVWFWIGPVLKAGWTLIKTVFGAIFAVIKFFVTMWYNIIKFYVKLMWTIISTVFRMIWKFIGPIVQIIYQLIRIGFQFAYQVVKSYVTFIWNAIKWAWDKIKAGTKVAWDLVKKYIVDPVRGAYASAKVYWTKITTEIKDKFNTVKEWIRTAWNKVTSFILDPIRDANDKIGGFLDGIKQKILGFVDKITKPLEEARDLLKKLNPASHFSPSVVEQAHWGWQAMERVSRSGIKRVANVLKRNVPTIRTDMGGTVPPGPSGPGGWQPPPSPGSSGGGTYFGPGAIQQTIHTQEINPIKHATDLGWEVARQM